jgi:hypothetical protein
MSRSIAALSNTHRNQYYKKYTSPLEKDFEMQEAGALKNISKRRLLIKYIVSQLKKLKSDS